MSANRINKKFEKHKLLTHKVSLSLIPVIITVVCVSYILAFALCFVGFSVGYRAQNPDTLISDISLLESDVEYIDSENNFLSQIIVDEFILDEPSENTVLGVSDLDSTEYLTKPNYDSTILPAFPVEDVVYQESVGLQNEPDVEINRISPSRSYPVNNNLLEYIFKIAFPVLAISLSVFGVNLLHSLKKPTVRKKTNN